MKKQITAFIFLATAAATTADAQCSLAIPANVMVVTSSATLVNGGEVAWVCEGATVIDQGGADTLYLEKNVNCTSNGGGAVIYAKTGCVVTLNGASEEVIYEAGVTIINMGGAGQLISCSSLIYHYLSAPVPGCSSLGIEEKIINDGMGLYPNPASQFLHIQLPERQGNVSGNIRVNNCLGATVYSEDVQFFSGEAKVNVNKLQSGIYMLAVSCNEERYAELLIIK